MLAEKRMQNHDSINRQIIDVNILKVLKDMESFILPKIIEWIDNVIKDSLRLKDSEDADLITIRQLRALADRYRTEYMYELRSRMAIKS